MAKEAVDYAVNNGKLILMMVDGYQTKQEAIYLVNLLWYARDKGVEVRIIPNQIKDEKN